MRFRFWVCISAGLFAAGIALGFVAEAYRPDSLISILSGQIAALEELGQRLQPYDAATALFIFLKNISVLVLSCLFTPAFGIFPVLTLLGNGTLLSFVMIIVARETTAWTALAAILPHGIFEIPAIIIGEAAALSISFTLIMAVFKTERRAGLKKELKRDLRYMLIAGALLVPAAVIEAFVTPLLLRSAAP